MTEKERLLPQIDAALCTGCGECVPACPVDALAVVDGKVVLNPAKDCDYCGECELACAPGAILCPFEIVFNESVA